MANCCNSIFDLGCLLDCAEIIFSTAQQNGDHTIVVRGGFNPKTTTENLIINDSICITINENFDFGLQYVANIINPDGTPFSVTIDSVVYDCFKFELENTVAI